MECVQFFFGIFSSESKSRMGEGRRRWSVAGWGRRWRGRHRGHFQIPCGIVARGGRRQFICKKPEHLCKVYMSLLTHANTIRGTDYCNVQYVLLLWRVAVCCGVLQCVAACCSVLQCVAVCWRRGGGAAIRCNTLYQEKCARSC